MRDIIDLYMGKYDGRDIAHPQRLGFWKTQIGDVPLGDMTDDHVHAGLEALAKIPPRYFAGKDAEGRPILKAKKKAISGATANRYLASIGAVFTWTIRSRIAPKGFIHPCRSVERKPESTGKTRFLDTAERQRLLEAARASPWPRMYALVLMALTTGARRGELLGLRWADVDFEHGVAHVGRSKNGDPKVLPLAPDTAAESAAAQAAAAETARKKWAELVAQYRTAAEKQAEVERTIRTAGTAAGASTAEIERLIAASNEKSAGKGLAEAIRIAGAKVEADIAAFGRGMRTMIADYENDERMLDARRSAGMAGERDYYAERIRLAKLRQ